MPRSELKLSVPLEKIQILDADGNVDEELLPELDRDRLRSLHRCMLLARRFDERLLRLQRQGDVGTFAPVKGQEASQVGAAAALNENDWVVPSFRETAVALWRGLPMSGLFLYSAGYNEGGAIPEEKHDLPIAIPVASQLPHAVGIAYAAKLRQSGEVVLAFLGDGATSEGDFHEAANLAAVLEAPVIFLCQNNQWAISVPRSRQTISETLAQKAVAYGMPGVQVDGNDVLGVYRATYEAVERARNGEGPTLIECDTYRLSVHTTADDPTRYRKEDEVTEWEGRDPLPRFQRFLTERELLDADDLKPLEEEIENEIGEAWAQAKRMMEELDDPVVIFDHLFAERSPYLELQRSWFSKERDRNDGAPTGGTEEEEEEGEGEDESQEVSKHQAHHG